MYFLLAAILALLTIPSADAYEGDPDCVVENVNLISGHYSELEIDAIVASPDPLVFYRSYDSRNGWSLSPQCFLYIQRDSQPKTYSTGEGIFEQVRVLIHTEKGGALTYFGWLNPYVISSFKLDTTGLANTAHQNINAWTNPKNNQLVWENGKYSLTLSNGGKRIYIPSSNNPSLYLLTLETLPSGNRVFYSYEEDLLSEIKMTNVSEEKTLSWIQLDYNDGIHLITSDNQTIHYIFDGNLLSNVIRSNKPSLEYRYEGSFLIKNGLHYYPDGKVESIGSTHYIYGNGFTLVTGKNKKIYRFDEQFQLVAIEDYLGDSLYRVRKKVWGKKADAANLLSLSLEDGAGIEHFSKAFVYDEKGNLLEEEETGNLSGTKEGESYTKSYSYQTSKDFDIISQKDAKGTGVKSYYKKGTNILIKKLIFQKKNITNRWFYNYNEDGTLIETIVDDGDEDEITSYDRFNERHITRITPKANMPNIGAPEIIEERTQETLLKQVVNRFDDYGNIISSEVYDANGDHRYTTCKTYLNGRLTSETDSAGNITQYTYDKNDNIFSIHSPTRSVTYKYDSENRRISVTEGNLTTRFTYDNDGNKISEIDPFDHQTHYTYDELGRTTSIFYTGDSSPYLYNYDLFDSIICITNPAGESTQQISTARGTPIQILHPDGTQELFKYDLEGSLHRHLGKDGIIKIFEYDYIGRPAHIEYYERGSKGKNEGFKREYFEYDAFHLISFEDVNGIKTNYTYDEAGRLASLIKESRKEEYFYDALGRMSSTKKWKSAKAFTLEEREYDLLGNIIEERIKDNSGKLLFKARYKYDPAGRFQEIIAYPHNQESVICAFQYDGLGRPTSITDAYGAITTIRYQGNHCITTNAKGITTETVSEPSKISTTKKDPFGNLLFKSLSSFDSFGNLTSASADGITTSRTYSAGKMTQNEQGEEFTYDSYGNISSIKVPGFDTPIKIQYDAEGNVSSCNETTFTFDAKGRLTSTQLAFAKITYELTSEDLVESETVKDKFGSYQTKASYDGEGYVTAIHLPDGSWIKYNYEGPFISSISRQSKGKKELYTYRVVARDLMGNVLEEILPQHAGARKQIWDKAGRKVRVITDFFTDTIDAWDSSHNIKKRGGLEYEYNALDELVKEPGLTYSYDSKGCRLPISDPTPIGEMDVFGCYTSIKDVSFTYDLNRKRLSKTSKDKTTRYFYLGNIELGSLDEKGRILELKVPSDPNRPDSPAIAIELQGDYYIPIYDIVGNIARLITSDSRDIAESYSYTAFGQESIFNDQGKSISPSTAINPWRYKGKRVDPETNLIYFGKRYYDPKLGCFISPDPAGIVDGLNLHRFCRNNPLIYTDHYGLNAETNSEAFNQYFYGEYEPHCHCEHHRDCKRGGDIQNALGGVSLGVASYFMTILSSFAEAGFLATADDFGFDRSLKMEMYDAMKHSLDQLHGMWNEGLATAINFDPQHEQTHFYEKGAYAGLVALDVLRGNMKDIKKGFSFFKSLKQPKLPVDLSITIERIQKGIKFPHRNDGTIFKNREGLLPRKHSTYYREYVHPTLGVEGPGAQRIIIGEKSEIFYSPDHYKTFIKIQ